MDLTDMTLAYESPDGELLEFGPTSIYRFGDLDVLDSAWECELVGDDHARVAPARVGVGQIVHLGALLST